jgi:outer membrane protein OmpA-like peptidoglycan-associated protein
MPALQRSPGSRALCILTAAGVLAATTGCASLNRTEEGAAVGGAAGAVVGGIIGNNTGSTTRGAIIGAVLGGAAGAAIGNRMDRQARELERELPNATVERVGEGIGVTFDSGILFDLDESSLRPQAEDNLAELAESLESYEDTRVLVVGHTDATGSDAYNQSLSERRAESARAFLLRRGIEPDRVEALGRGESEPVATNETAEGRQLNRRVEIAIFASEELQEEMLERHGG